MLNHQNAKSHDITVLVRSDEKAKVLREKFGVKTAIGNISDSDFVEKTVSNAHVVFQIVSEILFDPVDSFLMSLSPQLGRC